MQSCLLGLAACCCAFGGGYDQALQAHLDYARQSAEQGNYRQAIAHSDLLLFGPVLKIGVAYGELGPEERARCAAALRRVEQAWEVALEGEMDITFVQDGDAPINIDFKRRVKWNGRTVGGSIRWSRAVYPTRDGAYNATVKAEISVCGAMSEDAVVHAAAHEIGHLFGLKDSRRGIMGRLNKSNPVTTIDQDAINALRELRTQAAVVRSYSLLALAGPPVGVARS